MKKQGSSQSKRLQKLSQLVEMKSLLAQNRLNSARSVARNIERAIQELEDIREDSERQSVGSRDIANTSNLLGWYVWVEQEKRRLNIELAKATVVSEDTIRDAQKSMGQEVVAKALLVRTKT